MGAWKLNLSYRLMILYIMKAFFTHFLPMFSTFDVKMVNVVENAECFRRGLLIRELWNFNLFRGLLAHSRHCSSVWRKKCHLNTLTKTFITIQRNYICICLQNLAIASKYSMYNFPSFIGVLLYRSRFVLMIF